MVLTLLQMMAVHSHSCALMQFYAPSCASFSSCHDSDLKAPLTKHHCGSDGDTTDCCAWDARNDGCMLKGIYPCYGSKEKNAGKLASKEKDCSAMQLYGPKCGNLLGCRDYDPKMPLTKHDCGSDGDTTDCCTWDAHNDGCMLKGIYPCYRSKENYAGKHTSKEKDCSAMQLYGLNCESFSGCRDFDPNVSLTKHVCGSDGDTTDCCTWDARNDGCMLKVPDRTYAYPCYASKVDFKLNVLTDSVELPDLAGNGKHVLQAILLVGMFAFGLAAVWRARSQLAQAVAETAPSPSE